MSTPATSFGPRIPDNAPFNADQRKWLNGFLAELLLSTPQAETTAAVSLRVAVCFATQSGTAERLAKKTAKQLKAQGHKAEVFSLEKLSPAQLAEHTHALLFASTYGEGEPPDAARPFREALFRDGAPAFTSLRFAVFCLGDRTYEQFCRFGVELDERIAELGGERLLPRVECDVDVDAPFDAWTGSLLPRLTAAEAEATTPSPTSPPATTNASEPAQVHTRENPWRAEIRECRALTAPDSGKLTLHVSLALDRTELHYQPGDACAVLARNDPAQVDEILSLLPFDAAEIVSIPRAGEHTLRNALLHHLQHTRLTRRIVEAFAAKTEAPSLQALLAPSATAELETFLHGRGLVDLLQAFSGAVESAEALVAMLPRLAPRLYSISSSPAAHGRNLHCTIAVVRYHSHNRERGGVASTMFARATPGSSVPIYIQPNKRFRIPGDSSLPIIMIGPGTGIAPFRSFLHERQALGHGGRNWLFFGERSASTDFLYREELQAMHKSGHLTRLDTAFSRDQERKIYVQDRMREQSAELFRWLEQGAQVFVCGDASRMARDVDTALHDIVVQHGGTTSERAAEYVSELNEAGRYHRDVY